MSVPIYNFLSKDYTYDSKQTMIVEISAIFEILILLLANSEN